MTRMKGILKNKLMIIVWKWTEEAGQ